MKKLLLILSLLTIASYSFAQQTENMGNNVYSVFTENFNGVKINLQDWLGQSGRPESPNLNSIDRAVFWPDAWTGGNPVTINVSTVQYSSLSESKDGNIFWRITATINSATSIWVPVFFHDGTAEVQRNMADVANNRNYTGGTLEFWIRSSSPEVEKVRVGIKTGGANRVLPLSSCGFNTANTGWQKISIPLNNLPAGTSLTNVSAPFILLAEAAYFNTLPKNLTIDIDGVVWKKSGNAISFNAKMMNVVSHTSTTASSITWSGITLPQTKWKAADQYLELNLDCIPGDDWGIQVYSNHRSVAASSFTGTVTPDTAFGLISTSTRVEMLPMAWRVTDKALPFGSAQTLIIAENKSSNGGLYDVGITSPVATYYPWFYLRDRQQFAAVSVTTATVRDGGEDIRVWDKRGFHGAFGKDATGNGYYWGMSPGGAIYMRIAPKLYFAADFSMASTPNSYRNTTITVELFYE